MPTCFGIHFLCVLLLALFAFGAPTTKISVPTSCTSVASELEQTCILFESPGELIKQDDKTRYNKGAMICPCSPTKRGSTKNATESFHKIGEYVADFRKKAKRNIFELTGIIENGKTVEAKFRKAMEDCIKQNSVEACVNADMRLRGERESICTYDAKTGKNIANNGTDAKPTFYTLDTCGKSQTYKLKEASINEGCVAVEHLHGYVLQHPSHLLRPVLCSNSFCATPNHAIIVKGEMTSMKHLCGSGRWECEKKVKLVNNLKISANRLAKVNDDITITPYDIRFPKAAIWAVQMLEDVWSVFALSVCTGTLAGIAVLLVSKAETKN